MFSKKPDELKKLNDFCSDHTALLEKKRELYLETQQQSRSNMLAKSRNIESFLTDFDEDISQKDIDIMSSPTKNGLELSIANLNIMEEEKEKDSNVSESAVKKKKKDLKTKKKAKQYAKIFSIPEHMFSIPSDLRPEDWLIIPRPDGIKCLIVSRKGTTYLIDKNGCIVKAFECEFPGGNPKNKKGTAIVEGIFDKTSKICYLLDILFWNGQNFMECSSEMRFFWLESHVQSLKQEENSYLKFKNLPKFPCNSQGFNSAYQMNFGFVKNGLLFVAKKGPYISGINPYVLLWKDAGCCLYLYTQNMTESFHVNLRLSKTGDLVTLDNISLKQLKQEEMDVLKLKKGDLVKVEVDENDFMDLNFVENSSKTLSLNNLKVIERVNSRKALSDSFSKVLFIYHIKNKPLTMSQLDEHLKKLYFL